MAKNIVAGSDRRKRSVLRNWTGSTSYITDNVIIYDNRLYIVTADHISANTFTATSFYRLLDQRFMSAGFRDTGPHWSQAGYSGNYGTGTILADHTNNEVVVGFAPIANYSDNGGWSDGGRVTVRYGFYLRFKKLNLVD